MKLRELVLSWDNLKNISKPISSRMMKVTSAVLTRDGVGTVLCIKCNTLNLVRDGIFQCHCGYNADVIDCACGCGGQLLDRSCEGRLRQCIDHHHGRCHNNSSWKGGRTKTGYGYWLIHMPGHREANDHGYVFEHRLVYEEFYKCCLLTWSVIHHKDGDGGNNDINNLILTSSSEHSNKYHREDFGQVCERCGSTNIRSNGFIERDKQRQRFICSSCGLNWTANKNQNLDYGLICKNCSSKHIRSSGIHDDKHLFRCRDCKKCWYIPEADVVVKKSNNDLQYEERIRRAKDIPIGRKKRRLIIPMV
jgi:transposase-like protein